jgi:hypothetical protein
MTGYSFKIAQMTMCALILTLKYMTSTVHFEYLRNKKVAFDFCRL